MIISIGLLIIVIILEQILSYYLLKSKTEKPILNKISIVLLILFYFVFLNLTYYPPENYIFYDTVAKKYGIWQNMQVFNKYLFFQYKQAIIKNI